MSSPPWFRLYSEVKSDMKIKRVVTMTNQPKAVVIGVWSVLLCLANDSPERGKLLISEDMPLTDVEIINETGLAPECGQAVLSAFIQVGMISKDEETFLVTNWDNRQFTSDTSNDRVRQYRERQKQRQGSQKPPKLPQKPLEPPKNGGSGNENGQHPADTPSRYSNVTVTAPESDTESDAESDKECESTRPPAHEEPPPQKGTHTDPPTFDHRIITRLIELCGYKSHQVLRNDRLVARFNQATAHLVTRERASPEQLTAFKQDYWWGKSPPTPEQVCDEWGKFLNQQGGSDDKAATNRYESGLTDSQQAYLASLRENPRL